MVHKDRYDDANFVAEIDSYARQAERNPIKPTRGGEIRREGTLRLV